MIIIQQAICKKCSLLHCFLGLVLGTNKLLAGRIAGDVWDHTGTVLGRDLYKYPWVQSVLKLWEKVLELSGVARVGVTQRGNSRVSPHQVIHGFFLVWRSSVISLRWSKNGETPFHCTPEPWGVGPSCLVPEHRSSTKKYRRPCSGLFRLSLTPDPIKSGYRRVGSGAKEPRATLQWLDAVYQTFEQCQAFNEQKFAVC